MYSGLGRRRGVRERKRLRRSPERLQEPKMAPELPEQSARKRHASSADSLGRLEHLRGPADPSQVQLRQLAPGRLLRQELQHEHQSPGQQVLEGARRWHSTQLQKLPEHHQVRGQRRVIEQLAIEN